MPSERQVVDVERPFGNVLPKAKRGTLIISQIIPQASSRNGAGANLRGGEAIRIMQRDVPCAFAALGEAAEDDALVVDVESLLDGRDRLEDIHLAGPMPTGAIDAAEATELNLPHIRHRRIAWSPAVKKAVNELGFGC